MKDFGSIANSTQPRIIAKLQKGEVPGEEVPISGTPIRPLTLPSLPTSQETGGPLNYVNKILLFLL